MTRPSLARIDLAALRHNYATARSIHGGRALAVLKANAYGHGAVECARALSGVADAFAVAFFDEARQLRLAGIQEPILLLEGVFDEQEMSSARELGLWTVVHQEAQLRWMEADSNGRLVPRPVWLKVDTGMNRAGFAIDQVRDIRRRLVASGLASEVVLMSHFANADDPRSEATTRQTAAFNLAGAGLSGPRSLCNSAGLLRWPAAHRDWARPGILLYGADPVTDARHGLAPVMTLESRVFAERVLRPGDRLGYGGTFTAQRELRVGLVAIGYADGYPRSAPSGTPVVVGGKRTQLIGRVSMDMLTVDLTELTGEGVGSRVELWGRQVDVNTVAEAAGTISYELLCNVKRVPFVYTDDAIPTPTGCQPAR